MKVLSPVILLFLLALSASAQALSNPSVPAHVTVIHKKWRINVYNPSLDKDLLQTINKREQEERKRKEIERSNEIRAKQGMPTVPLPVRSPTIETTRKISVQYIYEVKVRNTGKKKIRALTWEYVFFEPGTEREVGRRQFVSNVSIRPGKTKNLVIYSAFPPTGTIDATNAGQKPLNQYSEQVVIKIVGYADGSEWRAVSN